MPVMQSPVRDPQKLSRDSDELHLLLLTQDDDLSGYRWREAVWLSLLVHAVVFIGLLTAPKWMPRGAILLPSAEMSKQNETFLVLPTDSTHPPKPPKTDIISDKDRIAQSRTPVPSREAIRRITNAQRPGDPTPSAPPPASAQHALQQQQMEPGGGAAPPQQRPAVQTAQVQAPPA